MPGRNLVYIPGSKTLGVSRQIADERERDRLKNIVSRLTPEDAGFIIRTVAENRSEDELHSDINYLISLWEDIREKYQTQEAPSLLHSDLNVIFRTLRDLFSSDIKKLVVDHKEEYKEIKNIVRSICLDMVQWWNIIHEGIRFLTTTTLKWKSIVLFLPRFGCAQGVLWSLTRPRL